MNPDSLVRHMYTRPNLPLPRGKPISKSVNERMFREPLIRQRAAAPQEMYDNPLWR